MTALTLVLGDQLSPGLSALRAADRHTDTVVMAEVMEEATYVRHHPKKIAFCFAAMRKFAARLEGEGWRVAYTRLDDPDNTQSIAGELARRARAEGAGEVLVTEPGEWRLREAIFGSDAIPIPVRCCSDDRFIASLEAFEAWAAGRRTLRMEYFYREMRRKTGLLMEGGQPVGGRWNYDHDNRKPASDDLFRPGPPRFDPDATVEAVLALVEERFSSNFGDLRPFWFATDHAQAEAALAHFIATRLPTFGDYQDAMLSNDRFLSHAVLGLYINAGLLDPLDVCQRAEKAYENGEVPINAAEGFIRQILGWREFVRGLYWRHMPDYADLNALDAAADLPDFFWTGDTEMTCVRQCIDQLLEHAYAHHIQRLMVLGLFGMLYGADPQQMNAWHEALYADAWEWVSMPNMIGMSQYADGGIVGTKPCAASGKYINRMSNYCQHCRYDPDVATGDDACPLTTLYWDFLARHREQFSGNRRMNFQLANLRRKGEDAVAAIREHAETVREGAANGSL